MQAFWASPFGPALYVHIPSVHQLDRRSVCLRWCPCGLRTYRAGDACAEWVRASRILLAGSRDGQV